MTIHYVTPAQRVKLLLRAPVGIDGDDRRGHDAVATLTGPHDEDQNVNEITSGGGRAGLGGGGLVGQLPLYARGGRGADVT